MRMNVTRAHVALLVCALAFGRSAHAGPADSPLPTFADGKAAVAETACRRYAATLERRLD